MPLFYQHNINADEKLGVWKIEENEDFFLSKVPSNRNISHQHKRLQHLAGRYLLQYLFPDFPYELIQIADTRKPFLFNETYHFSISHCGDFAAAIVSRWRRVGVDIELITPTIEKIQHKFLSDEEIQLLKDSEQSIYTNIDFIKNMEPTVEKNFSAGNYIPNINEVLRTDAAKAQGTSIQNNQPEHSPDKLEMLTLCWGAKEAMYKWYGKGGVDFKKDMQLSGFAKAVEGGWIAGSFIFKKEKPVPLLLKSRFFGNVVLSFVIS